MGEWINIEDLFRFIHASDFNLNICNDYYRLYLGEQNYGTLAYANNPFEMIEGRYIMVYFFEYLATLGLLDIAYTPPYYVRSDYRHLWGADDIDFLSRYDGLLYFRINTLGEYCLGLTSQYEPKQIATPYLFEINRHLDINLIREIQPNEEQILTLFASKNSDNEWEFSERKTLATIETGQKTQDIYDFLKQRTEADLAVEVKDFFAEQDHKASAFVDGGRAQIIHSSAHLIKIISSEISTKNLCHKIDAKTVIVSEKKEKEFYKALKKLGYLFLLTNNH